MRASPVTSSSVSATASMRPGKVIGGTVRRSTDGRGKEPTSNQSSSSRPNSKPNSRNNSRPNSRPGSLKKSKKLVSPPIDKKIAWHSVDGPETLVDCVTPVESTPIRSTTATEDVLLQSNGKGSSKSHTPPSGRQKRTGEWLIGLQNKEEETVCVGVYVCFNVVYCGYIRSLSFISCGRAMLFCLPWI